MDIVKKSSNSVAGHSVKTEMLGAVNVVFQNVCTTKPILMSIHNKSVHQSWDQTLFFYEHIRTHFLVMAVNGVSEVWCWVITFHVSCECSKITRFSKRHFVTYRQLTVPQIVLTTEFSSNVQYILWFSCHYADAKNQCLCEVCTTTHIVSKASRYMYSKTQWDFSQSTISKVSVSWS